MTKELFQTAEAVIYKFGNAEVVFIKGKSLETNKHYHALACNRHVNSKYCSLYLCEARYMEMSVFVAGLPCIRHLFYEDCEPYSINKALKECFIEEKELENFLRVYA
jgi:hypothetical protein